MAGGVVDGQAVNASVTNAAFLHKNADETMPFKLSMTEGTSGGTITNVQQAVNTLLSQTSSTETVAGTTSIAHGGTGQTSASAAFNALSPVTTLGDIIYGNGSNSNTRLAGNTTTTRKFLRQTGDGVNSAAPAWDTLVSGDIPNNAANTTGTSSNVTGTVAIANGGTGQTTKAAGFDALSPMTTGGDLIYGGTSGTGTRLANGTAGQLLQSNGTTTAPSWTTNISGNAANVTGTVAIANGGTGQTTKAAAFDALSPMTTGGDLIYGGASGTGTRLANGTAGQVLQSNGTTTAPTWTSNISGNAANVTGTVAIGNGGTGQTAKAAAFDALSPTTTKGDLIVYSTTNIRQAVGTDGQVLTADSTQTSGIKWATPATAGNLSVVNKTANYTLTTSDDVVTGSASGGSFTLTLPTAVGNTGKLFRLKRTDQTLANAITIATTSSQTIDGNTTRKLSTQYEEYSVVSDGSNWQIIAHDYPKIWVSYTPTYTGFGTVSNGTAYWRRDGDSIHIRGGVTPGTSTNVVATVTIPSGLSLNTGLVDQAFGATPIGRWVRDISTANTIKGGPLLYRTSDGVITFSYDDNATVADPLNNLVGTTLVPTTASLAYAMFTVLPITGWEA